MDRWTKRLGCPRIRLNRLGDRLQCVPGALHDLVGIFGSSTDPRALARHDFLPRSAQFGRLIIGGDIKMKLNAFRGVMGAVMACSLR